MREEELEGSLSDAVEVAAFRRRQPAGDWCFAPQRTEGLDQAGALPLSAPVELGLGVHRARPRARGQPPRHGRDGEPLSRPVVDGQGAAHSLRPRGAPQELLPRRGALELLRALGGRALGQAHQRPVPAARPRHSRQAHLADLAGQGRGAGRPRPHLPRRQLPEVVLLAPLPGHGPRPRGVRPRHHLPSLGERHGQLPALGRCPGEDLRRGGSFLHPLRSPARLRPLAPPDRQRVRPLPVAAGAPQAGPLRRGRHLREAPLPRQGRTLLRHPRRGQRGVVGDLRGRRCARGGQGADRRLDRTRPRGPRGAVGPRPRALPGPRRAGRRIRCACAP